MPQSAEMALADMAAEDRGYSIADPFNSFEEMDANGTEMYPGYLNIGLEVSPHVPVGTVFAPDMALNLAIRIDTADVVDTYHCTILRYPDLMEFRRKWLKNTGNKPVSLTRIRKELYCPGPLKVVPVSVSTQAVK